MRPKVGLKSTLLASGASRAVVALDLRDLHGPTEGIVELPHRLLWQPNRRVNLDNPALLSWMYETVLCEAVSAQELQHWLDGPTLIRLWPTLFLPAGVCRAWEEQHPVLDRGATLIVYGLVGRTAGLVDLFAH